MPELSGRERLTSDTTKIDIYIYNQDDYSQDQRQKITETYP